MTNLSTWWAYLIGPVDALIAVGFARGGPWAGQSAGSLYHLPDAPTQGASARDRSFDSNARELWRTLANHCELLTPAVIFKMNVGEPWRTSADDAPANFKTAGRHPWRCRRTDRSRRAPANFEFGE